MTNVTPVQSAAVIEQLSSDFSRLAGATSPASFLAVLADVQSTLAGSTDTQSSSSASATLGTASTASALPMTTTLEAPLAAQSSGTPTTVLSSLSQSANSALGAVTAALGEVGVPYVWGGASPATGFDCSGLVQWAYGQAGISLPRVASQQEQVGVAVPSLADAQPGDLVFYGNPAYHVGIYLGDGYMVDAPETGQTVSIQPVGSPTEIRSVTAATPSGGYGPLFAQATSEYGLPPGLLQAVATVESGMNPNAVSSAGAEGLMQLMPATAASLGVNPFDPQQAIDGAAQLLAGKLARFGSLPLALAAYNAGDGAVEQFGGIPPFQQTQQYVAKVLGVMEGAPSDQSA